MVIRILNLNYLPILQPSKMAVKCGPGWSQKPKVEPKPGCLNNIPINMFYILVFVSAEIFQILI